MGHGNHLRQDLVTYDAKIDWSLRYFGSNNGYKPQGDPSANNTNSRTNLLHNGMEISLIQNRGAGEVASPSRPQLRGAQWCEPLQDNRQEEEHHQRECLV